jgi:hypothetical protein
MGVKPLFYVRDDSIFRRPIERKANVSMGFRVCTVANGVDPDELCAIMNRGGEAPPERDGTPTSAAERAERDFNEA